MIRVGRVTRVIYGFAAVLGVVSALALFSRRETQSHDAVATRASLEMRLHWCQERPLMPTSGTAWAQKIDKTECTLGRAVADLAEVERVLAARPNDAATDALRGELWPVVLALRGNPKDPGHVNLPPG